MGSNGKQTPQRPRIELRQAAASPEEAAAIAAAIEQFLRDTDPPPQPSGPAVSPWLRAGLYESARLDPANANAVGRRRAVGPLEAPTPAEVVRRATDAWNAGDLAAAREFWAPDAVYDASERVLNPDVYRGHADLERFLDEVSQQWSSSTRDHRAHDRARLRAGSHAHHQHRARQRPAAWLSRSLSLRACGRYATERFRRPSFS